MSDHPQTDYVLSDVATQHPGEADQAWLARMHRIYGYGQTECNGGIRCKCPGCCGSTVPQLTAAERRKRLITIDGGQL
jgi:hypothetical protein